ncbi:hypothetical protein EXS57_00390 [Candidatus Kaiserbacteria bacterium]|nr:hypothetical protein [Candidatus Kaiserbacteria bacterium]
MQELSEQAQQTLFEFKRRLGALPAKERGKIISELTSSISSVNEDVKGMFKILQESMKKRDPEKTDENATLENISEYI